MSTTPDAMATLEIKQQADAMFEQTGLLGLLESFGEPYIHGSYRLDLMVWREIDVLIETEHLNSQMPFKMIAEMSKVLPPTIAMIVNQFNHKPIFRINAPENFLVDYRFVHAGLDWKLDLLIVPPGGKQVSAHYIDQIKKKLTPASREVIKSIKRSAIDSRLYRRSRWYFTRYGGSFNAHDIYRAVFLHGVQTPSEFSEYIQKKRGIDVRLG